MKATVYVAHGVRFVPADSLVSAIAAARRGR